MSKDKVRQTKGSKSGASIPVTATKVSHEHSAGCKTLDDESSSEGEKNPTASYDEKTTRDPEPTVIW